jgi:uncharacterized protein YecE (DUF72 family)
MPERSRQGKNGPSLEQPPPDPTLARAPQPARLGNILIGTASWAEKTLLESHAFYPASVSSAESRLRYYARHFPIVEVDSAFYSVPSLDHVLAWGERTPADFRFGIKAFAAMTQHQFRIERLPPEVRAMVPPDLAESDRALYPRQVPDEMILAIWRHFRSAIAPLQAAGKLAYVLFQMPKWFLPSAANDQFLERLPERMPGLPIAVEFRAASWFTERRAPRTLDLLHRHELSYTCVDEPQGTPASVPPIAEVTSPRLAVVRFHGRRAEMWDRPGVSTTERFGYLYPLDELRSWVPRLLELSEQAAEVAVLMNNCYRESAVRNAKDLAELVLAARA